jgi:hypothetical protein
MRAILALTLVGAVTTTVTALAQSPKQTPGSQTRAATQGNRIESVRTPNNERSLVQFWTAERLSQAQPMPLPRVDPSDIKN